jgi:hypothetical protein
MPNQESPRFPAGTPLPGAVRAEGKRRAYFPRHARLANAFPVQWVSGLRWVVPLLALLLGLGAAPAQAQTTISSSTTIDASNSINDSVEVVGDNTVVTIVSGGSIGGYLNAYAGTTVNVSGGSIGSYLTADGSTVSISGGSIGGDLGARDSTVSISGGSIGGDLFARHSSTVNVFGCNLVLADRRLTGTLQDGTAINGLFLSDDPIVLHNAPPVITCPPSVIVPTAPGLCGAHVTATATASANCPGVSLPVSGVRSDGQLLTALYPIGTTTITWTTTDAAGSQATCMQSITVKDTVGPTISGLAATPNRLWPPNHQMVEITVNYTASDNCAGAMTWALSASSNEPDSGLDKDDVPGDIQIVDAQHLNLRAERYGKRGRVYTLTLTGTDAAGNRTQQTLTVSVPH